VATLAHPAPAASADRRFFLHLAIGVGLLVALGFGSDIASGRAHIATLPFAVHIHGAAFTLWIGLFILQAWLADRGARALHRRLGWATAMLSLLMVPLGIAVTLLALRRGAVPAFFPHPIFLVLNTLGILAFGALVVSGIALRRDAIWHRRLIAAAAVELSAPALSRLLPMPMFGAAGPFVVTVLLFGFLAWGMAHDRRTLGFVPRAWFVAAGVMLSVPVLTGPLAFSPPGLALTASLEPR
jgi:hypothetical protein